MMRINHAAVLFQDWTSSKGLSEVQEAFTSIDELFHLCVAKKMSPERVLLSGKDDAGREHFLTLLYGAMRVAPGDSVEQEDPNIPSTPPEEHSPDPPPAHPAHRDGSLSQLGQAVLDAMSNSCTPAGPSAEEPSYWEDIRELYHERAWDATVRLSDLAQSLSSLVNGIAWAQKVVEFRGTREADRSERAELATALEDGIGKIGHMRSMLAGFDRQLIALSGRLAK